MDPGSNTAYLVSLVRTEDLAPPDSESTVDMWVQALTQAANAVPTAKPSASPRPTRQKSSALSNLVVYCQSVRWRSYDGV